MQASKKRNSEVERPLCSDLGMLRNVGDESLAGALEEGWSAGQMGTAGVWQKSLSKGLVFSKWFTLWKK